MTFETVATPLSTEVGVVGVVDGCRAVADVVVDGDTGVVVLGVTVVVTTVVVVVVIAGAVGRVVVAGCPR